MGNASIAFTFYLGGRLVFRRSSCCRFCSCALRIADYCGISSKHLVEHFDGFNQLYVFAIRGGTLEVGHSWIKPPWSLSCVELIVGDLHFVIRHDTSLVDVGIIRSQVTSNGYVDAGAIAQVIDCLNETFSK